MTLVQQKPGIQRGNPTRALCRTCAAPIPEPKSVASATSWTCLGCSGAIRDHSSSYLGVMYTFLVMQCWAYLVYAFAGASCLQRRAQPGQRPRQVNSGASARLHAQPRQPLGAGRQGGA